MGFTIMFARGDSYEKGFKLQQKSGTPILTVFDEVFFTVKKDFKDRNYVFQKRMSDGGIVNDGNGHFTLSILPNDTNGLSFGEYDCDLEFVVGENEFKRTYEGKLTLLPETTHQNNEGGS
jgi:hypothetical protein